MNIRLIAPHDFPGLLASCLGMLVGAAIDAGHGGFVLLAGLCANTGSMSFADVVRLHVLCLPFMHAGMVMGGVLGAAFRALRIRQSSITLVAKQAAVGTARTLSMILSMSLGGYLWLGTGITLPEPADATMMLLAMMGGMTAGMCACSSGKARRRQTPHQVEGDENIFTLRGRFPLAAIYPDKPQPSRLRRIVSKGAARQ